MFPLVSNHKACLDSLYNFTRGVAASRLSIVRELPQFLPVFPRPHAIVIREAWPP